MLSHTQVEAIAALKKALTVLRREIGTDLTVLRALFLLEAAEADGRSIERRDLEALASKSGAISQATTSFNIKAMTDKTRNNTEAPLLETYRSAENEATKPIRITEAGLNVVQKALAESSLGL